MLPSHESSAIDTATAVRFARKRLVGIGWRADQGVAEPQKVRFWYDVPSASNGGASQANHVLAWAVKFGGVHAVEHGFAGPDAWIVDGAWVVIDATKGHGIGTMRITRPAGTTVPVPSSLGTVTRGPYVFWVLTPSITATGSNDPWSATTPKPGYRFLYVPMRLKESNPASGWGGLWYDKPAQVIADGRAYKTLGWNSGPGFPLVFQFEVPLNVHSLKFVFQPKYGGPPVEFALRLPLRGDAR